ncbi:TPA: type IV secretion system protein [Streptococcus equi subsp. zooepidemicus]|uniref:TrbL/VirB6 plasmid conjugal transfer protein n=1 Tax=Streptococcus equi subsp. zooepidemicus TaxID=40041 RepID=A0A7Z8ZUS4_STRSZ|nr:type IV secretion system protein [Streptococcus equi]KIS13082.1 membrane protein [Streptococcus equi subsp. zooepidemicus SzAM60]MCD3401592.1 type IV secretion system protein [Streptococcus equi subsp. zooepidemicus]VEF04874.1 TrbL/VirB6 plasmid conjugal transfer protein [Streptococcus equi subsp. zooepidemicus]HEL0020789.1 type IV secretion system protein [Streptococcus equi subsp. zooepidemicus]HEL0022642.1 type IV secretion system protein [Streptococcus equi subsp. zooepidemicus]
MNNITKSLAEYSSTVDTYADKISGALLPVASILILTFFLFDILSWNRRLGQEGGSLTVQLWMEVALGYVIAFLLVYNISDIFDFIVLVFNKGIALVDTVLPKENFKTDMDTSGISGWIFKQVVKMVGQATQYIADVVGLILVFMRFFQMYLLKAVAPLLVAFFMSDQTRPITINFLKLFSAYAFQGLLLIIIVKLYPALVSDDLFKASDGDWVTAFASIAKSIVYIVCLFGSQRLAKTLLNAM